MKSLEILKGTEYKAEFYTDKAIISTIFIPPEVLADSEEENKTNENDDPNAPDNADNADNANEAESTDNAVDDNDEGLPSTIIHINDHIVDFLDGEKMYIIVVGKRHVFVVPKSAFTNEETAAVKEKFSILLGIRYKTIQS